MAIKIVAQGWEWRYQIGSKTQPAHIYCQSEGDDGRPLCGNGFGARWTKTLASTSKKRKYPIGGCPSCVAKGKPMGLIYETKS